MRISDWSSDVCSSDLVAAALVVTVVIAAPAVVVVPVAVVAVVVALHVHKAGDEGAAGGEGALDEHEVADVEGLDPAPVAGATVAGAPRRGLRRHHRDGGPVALLDGEARRADRLDGAGDDRRLDRSLRSALLGGRGGGLRRRGRGGCKIGRAHV